MTETRTETDSLGPVEVSADAYWGAQTQRSITNFPFPASERMPLAIVHALALVKQAAARVNRAHGLAADIADAIDTAAAEVVAGRHDDQFPLVIWQTGSGTQSNMNVNEVIAGRANEVLTGTRGGKVPVHPNDHVNMSQSSNDSFPTALHVAAALAVKNKLKPALGLLIYELAEKSKQWADIVKIGRTHLQDATPLTLGQEFGGYAVQVTRGYERIQRAAADSYALAQGGTAVGTGLNAPEGFGAEFAREMATLTGLPFVTAENKFEALASKRSVGRAFGHAQHARRFAHQDRQRYPLARLRAALGAGRTALARERTGQLDHAGQGQPDPVRDADDGGRPSDWQSSGGDGGRHAGGISNLTCSSR